jgi:glycolate oxidase FAD binding subunit
MTRFAPSDLGELHDTVSIALAADEPVEVVGGGSKRGLGRPLQLPHTFDLWLLARIFNPRHLVKGW